MVIMKSTNRVVYGFKLLVINQNFMYFCDLRIYDCPHKIKRSRFQAYFIPFIRFKNSILKRLKRKEKKYYGIVFPRPEVG